MRKVKSAAALEKIPGRKTVKSTKNKMPAKAKPAPAPKKPDAESLALAAAIKQSGQATMMMMAELVKEMQAIKASTPEQITEWIFDFERDEFGNTSRIIASAPQKVVN